MKRIRLSVLWLCLLLALGLTGCGASNQNSPVTLTIWHVYGDQSNSPLNDLITQYNETEGKEKGISVVVTHVSNTNNIDEAVLSAYGKEPGAPKLPDIFVSYPKTVATLDDTQLLVDYHDYFTEAELGRFVQPFLDEGYFGDKLLILPVVKSTSMLFVNKTLFDRFAAETGASLEDLATWEGLFETACLYADWTDMQTPDIAWDGKAFIAHDDPFQYMQVGVESLGESFWRDGELSFAPAYETVWEPIAKAGIKGGLWTGDAFAASGPMRTGDVIASIASSAAVLYNPKTVTYNDNTSEAVEVVPLPCPVFADGEKLVVQRGAGFVTVKSTPEREKAACEFLKWLTEPACNTAFAVSTGYLPARQEAFDEHLEAAVESLAQPDYAGLYKAVLEMRTQYAFFTPPNFPGYLETEENVARNLRQMLAAARRAYMMDPEAPIQGFVDSAYSDFRMSVQGLAVG